ncbi:unnamed protein product, partial [Staurois parvus]
PCTSLENAARGSQYGCIFQCRRRAIRTNVTRPRVRISLCGYTILVQIRSGTT